MGRKEGDGCIFEEIPRRKLLGMTGEGSPRNDTLFPCHPERSEGSAVGNGT
jgi:hypothetical protein